MTEREQLIKDYQDVYASEQGKRVLADLDKQCLYKGNPFVPDSERATCYKLGAFRIINYIHNQIETNLMSDKTDEVINKGVSL